MAEAVASGLIDPRAADPRDRAWYARLALALDLARRRARARYLEAVLARLAPALANPLLERSSFDSLQSAARDTLEGLRRELMPWLEDAAPGAPPADARARWAAAWGDPDDPEVRRRIAETVAALEAGDLSRRP